MMTSNVFTEEFTREFYERVLRAAIPNLKLEHIIPFIYQWVEYYHHYIREDQQKRETIFVKAPTFGNFVDSLIKLMGADISSAQVLIPGSEDDIKQKLGDLLKRYIALLSIMIDNVTDTRRYPATSMYQPEI